MDNFWCCSCWYEVRVRSLLEVLLVLKVLVKPKNIRVCPKKCHIYRFLQSEKQDYLLVEVRNCNAENIMIILHSSKNKLTVSRCSSPTSQNLATKPDNITNQIENEEPIIITKADHPWGKHCTVSRKAT